MAASHADTRLAATDDLHIDLRDEDGVSWVDPEDLRVLLGFREDELPHARFSLAVRLGLASIFAVNAIAAFVRPSDFRGILEDNLLGQHLPDGVITLMVMGAGINDAAIAVALVVAGRRALTWRWAAAWLAVVALVKAMGLIF